MKLALLLLATLLLAGCAAPASTRTTAAPADHASASSASATHLTGTVWLPPNQGQERARSEVRFVINASDMAIVAKVRLGSRYSTELPTTIANAQVELRAPDGSLLASAMLGASGKMEETLRAQANTAGEHKLVLLTYGGSDGASLGDYVAFTIDATPRA